MTTLLRISEQEGARDIQIIGITEREKQSYLSILDEEYDFITEDKNDSKLLIKGVSDADYVRIKHLLRLTDHKG